MPRNATSNRLPTGSGVSERIKNLVGDVDITIGAEDSPNANERLVTFQALDMEGKPYVGRTQAILSVHGATWAAFDGDEALDFGGSGHTGTVTTVIDGTSTAAFTAAVVVSDANGVIAPIVNDAGNDTFVIRIDYGSGQVFETDAFTFGSG